MNSPRPPRLRLGVFDYLGWRFSLMDDAGVQQHVDGTAMWLGRVRRGSKLREALRMPRQLFIPTPGMYIVYFVAFCLFATPIIVAINGASWPTVGRFLALYPVFVGPPTLLSAITAIRFRRRSAEYVKLMKARALCPACIHSLEGLTVPEDDMVACPECGAKWRFSPGPVRASERPAT